LSKISIIVPVYNVEQYLSKCMDSIINQTLKDIEIICINDGSTDNSLEILIKYEKHDNRIIVINQKNGGLSHARNVGLKKVTSSYILFVDSDDWLELNTCEILYNAMISNNCDLVQCKTNIHYIERNHMKSKDNKSINRDIKGLVEITTNNFQISPFYAWSKLFKKEIIEKFQIDFPEGLYYEDSPFMWKYFSVSRNIFFIEDKLYNYLRRPDSILSKTFNRNSLISLDFLKVCFNYYDFLQKWNLYNKYQVMFWILFEDFFWSSLFLLNQKKRYLAFELASSFLVDKEIAHLKDKIEPKIYDLLENLKNKNFKKIYTLKENSFFKKLLQFIFVKQYRRSSIKIKILKIPVYKTKK
jgi:glycosyltransferase involved in cell wall biosynthesis